MRRTAQKEKAGEGPVRRCVAEEIGRRLGVRGVTEPPEFIGLDEFSMSGRRLYHAAFCNLVKREIVEVVEEQGRQRVEEYLDSLLDTERAKGWRWTYMKPLVRRFRCACPGQKWR